MTKIKNALDQLYPNAHIELNHENGFQLLVAVVLSAQTTDKKVNEATKGLFKAFPNAKTMAQATIDDIVKHIKILGLYRTKAANLIGLSKMLVEKFDNQIPNTLDELMMLPGVGRKTANVVLSNLYHIPRFAVDTHVERVAKRLNIANKKDSVLVVEEKLMKMFDKNDWSKLHHQLIFFGRYHCKAINPQCKVCPLYEVCVDPIKYR